MKSKRRKKAGSTPLIELDTQTVGKRLFSKKEVNHALLSVAVLFESNVLSQKYPQPRQ